MPVPSETFIGTMQTPCFKGLTNDTRFKAAGSLTQRACGAFQKERDSSCNLREDWLVPHWCFAGC